MAGIFLLLFFLVFDDYSYIIRFGWLMIERWVVGESFCMVVFKCVIFFSFFVW